MPVNNSKAYPSTCIANVPTACILYFAFSSVFKINMNILTCSLLQ